MSNTEASTNSVITNFVDDWPEKIDYYEKLAKKVEAICNEKLNEMNVRHLTSSRAKPQSSLQKSIERRQKLRKKKQKEAGQPETGFQDEQEIKHHMIDLAGARVKLYFPDNLKEVRGMIQNTFDPYYSDWKNSTVDWKRIRNELINKIKGASVARNDNKKGDQTIEDADSEWPLGYKALHFRCKLRPTDRDYVKFKGRPFEIQVASVMMHAWSEIYHDIIYKPYFGKVTDEEKRFLDIVNGLAHTGELALQQLQASLQQRLTLENASFDSQWQLGDWLRKALDYNVVIFQGLDLLCDILRAFNFT